jgi:hypothetical protein
VLPNLLMLGRIPAQAQLMTWLLSQAAPVVQKLATDPSGVLHRFGDLLIWNGPNGQQALATLEGLGEGQARIAGAVEHIQRAQIVMMGGIGAIAGLSLFHVGLTTLTAGLMLNRSLQKREDRSKTCPDCRGYCCEWAFATPAVPVAFRDFRSPSIMSGNRATVSASCPGNRCPYPLPQASAAGFAAAWRFR